MTADGRTIAPSPKRLHEAYLAGLRPHTPWLLSGFSCLALAVGIRHWGAQLSEMWSSWFLKSVQGSYDLSPWWYIWLIILCTSIFLSIVAAWISGNFGIVYRSRQKLFAGVGYRNQGIQFLLVAIAVIMIIFSSLHSVLAGAARSVDTSPEAIQTLWIIWLVRGLTISGLCLLAAAGLHLWLSKRHLWSALHQSPEEVRATLQGSRKR